MAKMKLDSIYPDIVNRFQYVKTTNADAWQKYVKSVIAEHEYNDLLTRIAWDLLRYVYTSGTIYGWYDKYNVHDSHITTAVKKAYVEIPICDSCADTFHLKWRCKEFRVHQWSGLRKETKWVKGRSNYTICELAHKLPHEEFVEYLKDNGIYIVNESGVELGW